MKSKSGETPQPQQKLRYFLGLPTYNGQSYTAMYNSAIQCYSGSPEATTECVTRSDSSVSALCFNYNQLWCSFLNLYKEGKVDAFAMLHSDIQIVGHPYWESGRSWVDWLWDTMQEKGLACLSVTNAIKSREGHTSTAMGQGKSAQRRLSFKDLENLPPTFDSDEFYDATGMTLLVNTGCMLIKPEPHWVDEFQFEFLDKIVTMQEDGKPKKVPMMFPEDWQMSRFFHSMNLKYGATSEIKTLHHGQWTFPNWDAKDGFYTQETQSIQV